MTTSEKFDPYHKWLGIPPSQQPPTHYRLLGLEPLEADREVIDAAANQRMAYLQDMSTGPHAPATQRLLNEVAAARRCLLNPKSKSAYDRVLKASLAVKPIPLGEDERANESTRIETVGRRRLPWPMKAAIALLIASAAIVVALSLRNSKSEADASSAKAIDPEPAARSAKTTRADQDLSAKKPTPPIEPIAKDPQAKEQTSPKGKGPRPEIVTKNPPPPTVSIPQAGRVPAAMGGRWQVVAQELIAPAEDGFVTFGDHNWNDYDFSCQARREKGDGSITLIVRGQGLGFGSSYTAEFGIGNADSLVTCWTGGKNAKPLLKSPRGLQPDTWLTLLVKIRGSKIECLADGRTVMKITNGAHPRGFVGFKGSGTRFKDVRVADPDGKLLWHGVPEIHK